jgi:hypothetical protein
MPWHRGCCYHLAGAVGLEIFISLCTPMIPPPKKKSKFTKKHIEYSMCLMTKYHLPPKVIAYLVDKALKEKTKVGQGISAR